MIDYTVLAGLASAWIFGFLLTALVAFAIGAGDRIGFALLSLTIYTTASGCGVLVAIGYHLAVIAIGG